MSRRGPLSSVSELTIEGQFTDAQRIISRGLLHKTSDIPGVGRDPPGHTGARALDPTDERGWETERSRFYSGRAEARLRGHGGRPAGFQGASRSRHNFFGLGAADGTHRRVNVFLTWINQPVVPIAALCSGRTARDTGVLR